MVTSDAVTRFEVIDHRAPVDDGVSCRGRVFVAHDVAVELSYQDDGRTLKVFIVDRAPEKAA